MAEHAKHTPSVPAKPTANRQSRRVKCHYLSETADIFLVRLAKHFIVEPGSKIRLKDRDPSDTFGKKRDDKRHQKTLQRLRELQHLLYADKRYSLLIVLQGLDASGKD